MKFYALIKIIYANHGAKIEKISTNKTHFIKHKIFISL